MNMKWLVPGALRADIPHKPKGTWRDTGRKFGEYMKKSYNPKDPIFVKDEVHGRSINNLWTGYKLGGKGNLMVAGSVLGGGTLVASNPQAYQDMFNRHETVAYQSEELDVESLPSTRGDHTGYQIPLSDMSNMQASGDLVFALHKTRHFGQL